MKTTSSNSNSSVLHSTLDTRHCGRSAKRSHAPAHSALDCSEVGTAITHGCRQAARRPAVRQTVPDSSSE